MRRNIQASVLFVQWHISTRQFQMMEPIKSHSYFCSGNWGVDLQAGSEFGYHLLFVVLLAGLVAAFLQVRPLHVLLLLVHS